MRPPIITMRPPLSVVVAFLTYCGAFWSLTNGSAFVHAFVMPSFPCGHSQLFTARDLSQPNLYLWQPRQRQQAHFSSFWLDPTRDTPLEEWNISEDHPGVPPTEAGNQVEDDFEGGDEGERRNAEYGRGRSIGGVASLCTDTAPANEIYKAANPSEETKLRASEDGVSRGKKDGFNVFKTISGGGLGGRGRFRPSFFTRSKDTFPSCMPRSNHVEGSRRAKAPRISAPVGPSGTASSTSTQSSAGSSAPLVSMPNLPSAKPASSQKSKALQGSSSANDYLDSVQASTSPGNNSNMQVLLSMVQSDPSKRLLVWAAFLGLGWTLRSFYGIILGTFVLSYIGSSAVRWSEEKGNELGGRLKLPPLPRRFWALAYVVLVLSSFVSLTVVTVPRVVGETNYLSLLIESENPYVFVADGVRRLLGPDFSGKVEAFLLSVTGEEGRAFATGVLSATSPTSSLFSGPSASSSTSSAAAAASVARKRLSQPLNGLPLEAWTPARSSRFAKLMEYSLKGYIKQAYFVTQKLLTSSTKLVYKGLLSLLFSFMIIWDLPRLARGTQRLARSRFGYAYSVLAPQLTAFGRLVGQSFEVQSIIALVNTLLTTLGLVFLKIPGYGFMSLVVLITSFIPVFGVFLSTLPMALVAVSEYGVGKMIDVILMVIGVHVVEAYCLSPLIYSATVKLHPVLIVAALYMMEHLAGLQGVFLAVPVTMFVIRQVLGIPADGHGKGSLEAREGQVVQA
ncbi:Uncharacterized protein family UPF0118 [Nannochloropsis gaditana]|uniref:Uncharacterized protein family UPF0118 n=1 Tax=Nannochloropsis gaditana TaxID=72520 RepID=W7T7D1_9STRA|nr:Uncharacterized protein family UPF0118 [Nannochloropsis gaditana]